VKETRLQKGLRQQDTVDRVSGFYGDVSSYRRIENGSRIPERDAAVAVLIHGLRIREVEKIDTLLALAEYEALSVTEVDDLGLTPSVAGSGPILPQLVTPTDDADRPKTSRGLLLIVAGVSASTVLSAGICSQTEYGVWLGLVLSAMYAGLYLVSLLLESAYEPQARRRSALSGVFCVMLLSSSGALATDATSINSGASNGLPMALSIFAAAAMLQAVVSRQTLPAYPVVKGRYQMHTARSAHLKNTCYFMLIVFLFWVPPLHAVTILRKEVRLGHAAFVRQTIPHWMLLGHGMISLSYGWLIGLLIAIVAISLPMRTQLLDNLKPSPHQDSYLHLFYIRALLYFALSGTCVVWYASAVGSLLDSAG
jgi:tetrahydromethanopterin S-methyltransferase subunit B